MGVPGPLLHFGQLGIERSLGDFLQRGIERGVHAQAAFGELIGIEVQAQRLLDQSHGIAVFGGGGARGANSHGLRLRLVRLLSRDFPEQHHPFPAV